MSIEAQPQDTTSVVNSSEALEAAKQLAGENDFCKKNPRTLKMIENEGHTVIDGKETVVDIGNYLASRIAALENNTESMAAARAKDPRAFEAAMVVHSVRPDLEQK